MFGNAGGGKSTLARRLAELTGLPLYPLDLIQFEIGGAAVPHERYLKEHAELLRRDTWIIDGYGCRPSAWERFAVADTLVYIDLPLVTHFAWVTKRLFRWRTPEGSPLVSSTISCYRTILRCHRHLTPDYRELVTRAQQEKRVHHLTSPAEIAAFLAAVQSGAPESGTR